MRNLSSRISGNFIHVRVPPDFHILGHVMLYLNKGGKFDMDQWQCSLSHVIGNVSRLEDRLHLAKVFDKSSSPYREQTRPAVRSTWLPPKSADVERYGRLLKRDLIKAFVPQECKRNKSWLDNKAVQWLKQHKRQTAVIDADKGLGDILMPRSWVVAELTRLLDEGHQKLEAEERRRQSFQARCTLESLAARAHGDAIIKQREAMFITQKSLHSKRAALGSGEKLHKNPVAGRPIANMSCSWCAPACLFLCSMLRPIQDALKYAVSGSVDVLSTMPLHAPEHYEIATIDVKNLYPSISTLHVLHVLTNAVYRHYSRSSLADFIVSFLNIVLKNRFIHHRGEFYQAFGIATGLPPGVFLASIYLDEVDVYVTQKHGDSIAYSSRLVDDSCAIAADVTTIQATQNEWRSKIKWEFACRGGRTTLHEPPVAFLDLSLSTSTVV